MTGNHNRDIVEAFLLNTESLQIVELKMPYTHNKGPKINVMWTHPCRWPLLFRIQIKWLNGTLHHNRIFHFSLVGHPPLGLGSGLALSQQLENLSTFSLAFMFHAARSHDPCSRLSLGSCGLCCWTVCTRRVLPPFCVPQSATNMRQICFFIHFTDNVEPSSRRLLFQEFIVILCRRTYHSWCPSAGPGVLSSYESLCPFSSPLFQSPPS